MIPSAARPIAARLRPSRYGNPSIELGEQSLQSSGTSRRRGCEHPLLLQDREELAWGDLLVSHDLEMAGGDFLLTSQQQHCATNFDLYLELYFVGTS